MKIKEILLKTVSGRDLIWKEGNVYYVQGAKYVGDVEMLLRIIKNIKPLTHQDVFYGDKSNSEEEYYTKIMCYQYNDGGLIGLTNPKQCWEDELCRQGKLNCDSCGEPKVMYYTPWCPTCEASKMYSKGKTHINMIMFQSYIGRKHGKGKEQEIIDYLRDFDYENDTTFRASGHAEGEIDEEEMRIWKFIIQCYNEVTGENISHEDSIFFEVSW